MAIFIGGYELKEDFKELDNRKIYLVTGCAGFIGFSISKCLLEKGCKVIGTDNLNEYYDVNLKKARLEIFKIHTKSMPIDKDVNLDELSEICENYSGADIEALCREAAMLAIRENAEAKKVKRAHFEKAMETVRASITPNMMKFYEKVSETLGSGIAKKDKSEKDIQYL